MGTQTPSHRTGFARLGTFEGLIFREPRAIERTLTAKDVIAWKHAADGEAVFWPSGDCPAMSLLFEDSATVTGRELRHIVDLLDAVGGDAEEMLLRLHVLVNLKRRELATVETSDIEDLNVHIFRGNCFRDLRKEAAYGLFERYWPELSALGDKIPLDGLRFETSDFLDSTLWQTEEIDLGRTNVVVVMPRA
jgi:hypothetical protein